MTGLWPSRTMRSPRVLAWSQLVRERARFAMALLGVGFAVVLMLMQLGFRRALFESAVRFHRAFAADVFLLHPRTEMLGDATSFPRRRLDQARSAPGVRSVGAVYTRALPWTNLRTGVTRNIFVVGVDPDAHVLDLPEVRAQSDRLRWPDAVLFDAASRAEYGPVEAEARATDRHQVELAGRQVTVAGLFRLGTSFGIDGTALTSDLNFLRLVPDRGPGLIDIGLIQLAPGADPRAVQAHLAHTLPADVRVLTRPEYMAREIRYWDTVTPIGYVFGFGVLVGFAVGAVIVAQILFADVSDHLAEYATLKAIGFGNRYLYAVVFYEAVLLAGLGYLPGVAASALLYRLAASATGLPLVLEARLALLVLGLTFAMCCLSGALALRKLESADPADIFR
jgi:putative ABC transport system permease protein